MTEHNNKLTNLNNSLKKYEKTQEIHEKRLEIINNLIDLIKKFEIYMNEFNELINNFKNDGNSGDTGYNGVIDKLNLVEGLKNEEHKLTILEPKLTELEKYDFQESESVFTKPKTIEEIFTKNLDKEDKEKLRKQKEQDILIPKPSETLKRSTSSINRISFADYKRRKNMSYYEKSQLQYGGSKYDAPSQDYFLRN